MSQAGAFFSGGLWRADAAGPGRNTRVARCRVAADLSTRRSEPGRLHPIRGASEQSKGVKIALKGGRIRTFEADFDTLPEAHDWSQQPIRPPHRAARRFVAESGARV
jgi:hypothetical protein